MVAFWGFTCPRETAIRVHVGQVCWLFRMLPSAWILGSQLLFGGHACFPENQDQVPNAFNKRPANDEPVAHQQHDTDSPWQKKTKHTDAFVDTGVPYHSAFPAAPKMASGSGVRRARARPQDAGPVRNPEAQRALMCILESFIVGEAQPHELDFDRFNYDDLVYNQDVSFSMGQLIRYYNGHDEAPQALLAMLVQWIDHQPQLMATDGPLVWSLCRHAAAPNPILATILLHLDYAHAPIQALLCKGIRKHALGTALAAGMLALRALGSTRWLKPAHVLCDLFHSGLLELQHTIRARESIETVLSALLDFAAACKDTALFHALMDFAGWGSPSAEEYADAVAQNAGLAKEAALYGAGSWDWSKPDACPECGARARDPCKPLCSWSL